MVVIMATRDEVFIKFEEKMLEALLRLLVVQLNMVRSQVGLPDLTQEGALNALNDMYDILPEYPWQETPPEEPPNGDPEPTD